jgi:translation initiation factor 3 subunit F
MATDPLALGSGTAAKVHPVVLFNILDHYTRRNDGQERVIGTLLGHINSDGSVEVKNSFPVPHNESAEQVAVDMEFHRTMYDLHLRVNPKEVIVGWYATGESITDHSVYIHEFFAREALNPIHLIVDTSLTKQKIDVKAFVSIPLTIGDKMLGAHFQRIRLETKTHETERIAVNHLAKTQFRSKKPELTTGLESLQTSIERLLSTIDIASDHIQSVLDNKIEADPKIGRMIAEAVSTIPKIDVEVFEKMFNSSLQDLLMVVYLGSLTRTQLALAHKLQAST